MYKCGSFEKGKKCIYWTFLGEMQLLKDLSCSWRGLLEVISQCWILNHPSRASKVKHTSSIPQKLVAENHSLNLLSRLTLRAGVHHQSFCPGLFHRFWPTRWWWRGMLSVYLSSWQLLSCWRFYCLPKRTPQWQLMTQLQLYLWTSSFSWLWQLLGQSFPQSPHSSRKTGAFWLMRGLVC